jgi:hypothetical protein
MAPLQSPVPSAAQAILSRFFPADNLRSAVTKKQKDKG